MKHIVCLLSIKSAGKIMQLHTNPQAHNINENWIDYIDFNYNK